VRWRPILFARDVQKYYCEWCEVATPSKDAITKHLEDEGHVKAARLRKSTDSDSDRVQSTDTTADQVDESITDLSTINSNSLDLNGTAGDSDSWTRKYAGLTCDICGLWDIDISMEDFIDHFWDDCHALCVE